VTFQATMPRMMTATNQQEFTTDGTGDMIISVPNGSASNAIHLTSVLYTPLVGLMLVSIGQIDNAGYICLFGNGHCEICRRNRELVGIIPKQQALY